MASFPVDILMEIFLRLSARPLVRFRCVCKSWKSLLTSPSFIKAFLERSIELRKFHLLKFDLDDLSRVQVWHSPESEPSDLDTSFVEDSKNFRLVGSCNGIVCLSKFNSRNYQHSKFFLWNPSTGENIALPQKSFHVSNLVGFGLDPLSGHPDDFIVVDVNLQFVLNPHFHYTSQVEVYNFRKNCWKQLGDIFPPSLTQPRGDQVIFENFICWGPCNRHGLERVTLLILFDVAKDVFQTIALPDIMPPEENYVSLLDGRLSVIALNSSVGHYEVWIMQEFAVYASWTRLSTIGMPTQSIASCSPLGFTDSGKIFFISSTFRDSPTYLVLYDGRTEKSVALRIKVDSSYSTRLVTCVESLISLSSTNIVEQ